MSRIVSRFLKKIDTLHFCLKKAITKYNSITIYSNTVCSKQTFQKTHTSIYDFKLHFITKVQIRLAALLFTYVRSRGSTWQDIWTTGELEHVSILESIGIGVIQLY